MEEQHCYALFDEDDYIVKLYSTKEKADQGLLEFKKDHDTVDFYIDKVKIH